MQGILLPARQVASIPPRPLPGSLENIGPWTCACRRWGHSSVHLEQRYGQRLQGQCRIEPEGWEAALTHSQQVIKQLPGAT